MEDHDDFFDEFEEISIHDKWDDYIPDDTLPAIEASNEYITAFSGTCFNQPQFALASFHMLLGSLPSIRKITAQKGETILDPRFHVFYIAPSGSGKGAAINFIMKCAAATGITVNSLGAITANALTGTRDKADKPRKDATEFEKWPLTDGYLNPDAMPSNIVMFTEAAELVTVKPVPDMRKCLDHFQKAMNPINSEDSRISKKTALGPEITFFPNSTLFFTTYKPTEFADVIITRGFIQRCLLLTRDVSIEDRFADIEAVNETMGTYTSIPAPVITTFQKVEKFYADSDIKHLLVDPNVGAIISGYIKLHKRIIYNCNSYIQERLIDFVPRFNDLYWKLAMHSCFLRLDNTIRIEDAEYAFTALHDILNSTLEFLQNNLIVPLPIQNLSKERFKMVQTIFQAAEKKTGRKSFDKRKVTDTLIKNKIFPSSREASRYLIRLHTLGAARITGSNIELIRGLYLGEIA